MDNEHTDPEQVAQKDYRTWITEAILDHRPKKKRKQLRRSQLEFLVKWQGYPSEENTWEPWANLRRNILAHEYLRNHRMAYIIPQNLRENAAEDESVSE